MADTPNVPTPVTAAPVGLTAQPMTAQPATAPVAPVQGAKMADTRKDELAAEQKVLKDVNAESEGKDYFEQQEVFAKAFEEMEGEDSFRRATRIERERDALLSAGDPTRDPVAKQKAMDMNTVQPGAVADAQKIKDIGAKDVADRK